MKKRLMMFCILMAYFLVNIHGDDSKQENEKLFDGMAASIYFEHVSSDEIRMTYFILIKYLGDNMPIVYWDGSQHVPDENQKRVTLDPLALAGDGINNVDDISFNIDQETIYLGVAEDMDRYYSVFRNKNFDYLSKKFGSVYLTTHL